MLGLWTIDQQHAHQRPLFEVEAALGVGEQRRAFVHRRNAYLPQHRRIGNRLMFGMPLASDVAETQTQGVVLFDHRQQRLLQAMGFQRRSRLQQQRLVPVLALWNVGVEEPVLDRRQTRLTADQALLGGDLLGAGRHGGEGLHGLVLEQVARAEVNALLPRTADHLDRQDRVAAQFEEVVVEADLFDVEHLAPDLRQGDFELVARRHVLLTIQLRVRRRQRATVEFAVGGQRHAGEQNQVRGHHVIRQLRLEMRLECFAQFSLLRLTKLCDFGDQIAHQLFAARCIERQHHGFTHRLVFQQTGFDFTEFDAETANLHLMVNPPQVFHQTIRALPHQVASAINTSAIVGERIRHKAFGGHAWTLVITLRQTRATDVQLTGRALRHQRQIGVENVRHAVADHAADRHAAQAFVQHLRRETGQRHDHGFGRPVCVEERARFERCTNARQVFAGQRFAAGDDHAHRQNFIAGRQPLRQLAAVAWSETEDVDVMGADQPADFFGIPLALRTQHHLRAAQQRHQQTLGGGVEVDRIEMQFAIVRAHAKALDHSTAVHGDFAVGHHHTFRLAGGTRGVDQVRLMLRQADEGQLSGRVIGQRGSVFFHAPAADRRRQFAESLEHRRVTEQQADAAVFDHVVQAIERVLRVQRHVGATGLEDRQQADDHFQRTLKRQAHAHLRPDTPLAQHPREAIGAAVEFGIAQGLPGKRQRRRIGTRQCLFAEQVMDALVEAMFPLLNAKAVEQVFLFLGCQQRQFTEALLRIGNQRFQQVAPMCGHPRNARFVEQISAVGQAATQAMVEVGDFQVEVELGRPGIVGQVLDRHASQGSALLEFPALHVAHHLEQRVVSGAARWLQGFHQMIERQVLMGLAFDHRMTNLLEQLAHGHLPVELAAQHLSIEERTDQPFAFRTDAVGHRRADAQVGLAAVAI
ncbi:hypothetical protein D3C73_424990 [compost metagenome]